MNTPIDLSKISIEGILLSEISFGNFTSLGELTDFDNKINTYLMKKYGQKIFNVKREILLGEDFCDKYDERFSELEWNEEWRPLLIDGKEYKIIHIFESYYISSHSFTYPKIGEDEDGNRVLILADSYIADKSVIEERISKIQMEVSEIQKGLDLLK